MATVGQRIRMLRREKRINQAELGFQLGVSDKTVRRWESGQSGGPNAEQIEKLAEVLGISPACFFTVDKSSEPERQLSLVDTEAESSVAIKSERAPKHLRDKDEDFTDCAIIEPDGRAKFPNSEIGLKMMREYIQLTMGVEAQKAEAKV